jgi:GNAT superfamily N-acetyltransferase
MTASAPERIRVEPIDSASPYYEGEQDLRDRLFRLPYGRPSSRTEYARDATGAHFVAIDGERVIGCVGFYPGDDGAATVRHLAVEEGFQRSGVGGALMRYGEAWCREKGIDRFEVTARTDAQSFYEACGYVTTSETSERFGVSQIKLVKTARIG